MCTLRYLIPEREYAKVFKKGELCLHGLHGPIMSLAPSEPLHWLPSLRERLTPSFHPMRLLLIVSLLGHNCGSLVSRSVWSPQCLLGARLLVHVRSKLNK